MTRLAGRAEEPRYLPFAEALCQVSHGLTSMRGQGSAVVITYVVLEPQTPG